MDTQRLILFIVFSFSILMLWDAWQKEQHPAPAVSVVQEKRGIMHTPAPLTQAADTLAKEAGGK